MKKTIALLALLAVTMLAMAQAAGGQVKRPVISNSNKYSVPKHKNHVMSQSDRDRIIQNLINNMVYVEGGTFMMGATPEQGSDAEVKEKPAHQVTLSSFSIGKYEVTQEEWLAVMGKNPSEMKGLKFPVECVNWNDCQDFIRKLNAMTGKQFRLPTEAEWEYAARGGNRSMGYKYAGSNNLEDVANYKYDAQYGAKYLVNKLHAVGQKIPNELGLYNMSDNVMEWCQDNYKEGYGGTPVTNPTGPPSGTQRVKRGAGRSIIVSHCRVSARLMCEPDKWQVSLSSTGLRLALSESSHKE